ncbi:MAG: DUF523 domain-containing protein [Candidatus Aenigmatarchaeota archaeon]|nr:MAG: DUF523 domain-containing protein [Candidatus Aenigmarchaeota archaeon]
MKIVSACLIGVNCRYDGRNKFNSKVSEMFKKGVLVPVCPEQLGGLPTPREPNEITGGTGSDVLEGKAKVLTKSGKDVTENFLAGAKQALQMAESSGAKEAILKSDSPSCGFGEIYDGTFSGRLVKGDGVTTALLRKNGISIKTEKDIK